MIRRQLALVMAMALLAVAVSAVAAGAGVERYQFKTYDISVTSVNGYSTFTHTFNISLDNPCDGTYSGTGYFGDHAMDEFVSMIDMTDGVLSFKSLYDRADNYTWFPSFTLNPDYTLTFHDGYGSDNVTAATGTWTMTQTDYNHGEYVAENVEEYGNPATAHSCIGMPMVSNRDK